MRIQTIKTMRHKTKLNIYKSIIVFVILWAIKSLQDGFEDYSDKSELKENEIFSKNSLNFLFDKYKPKLLDHPERVDIKNAERANLNKKQYRILHFTHSSTFLFYNSYLSIFCVSN